VDAEGDFYTLYFSRGMPLEAAALARHLGDPTPGRLRRVLQVYREGADRGAAAALRQAVNGIGGLALAEHGVPATASLTAANWSALLQRERPDILVAWLPPRDLRGLGEAREELAKLEKVFLSVTMLADGLDTLPPEVRAKAYLTSPFERPDLVAGRLMRAHGWMRGRGVAAVDDRAQSGAFFVVTLAAEAIMELRGYFSRDYFIERIEHMIDGTVTTSVYPRLTLAPGARFASQGCYILRFDESDPLRLVAASDWIVP
jgi:hypothetical protein